MVRTNVEIDDALLLEAQELAGTRTKKATVEFALAELIRRTTDCLIATVCIREERPLLHNDLDFDHLAVVSALRVVKQG